MYTLLIHNHEWFSPVAKPHGGRNLARRKWHLGGKCKPTRHSGPPHLRRERSVGALEAGICARVAPSLSRQSHDLSDASPRINGGPGRDACEASSEEKSERAPRSASVVGSARACVVCGMPLSGRPHQKCCSAKCRAEKSRRQRRDTEAALHDRLRLVLESALMLLNASEFNRRAG